VHAPVLADEAGARDEAEKGGTDGRTTGLQFGRKSYQDDVPDDVIGPGQPVLVGGPPFEQVSIVLGPPRRGQRQFGLDDLSESGRYFDTFADGEEEVIPVATDLDVRSKEVLLPKDPAS